MKEKTKFTRCRRKLSESRPVVDNLAIFYGFFFVMMSFLITGLQDLRFYFGPIELYVIYGAMWLLGLSSYLIGMYVKDIMRTEIKDLWVLRALWLFVIIVATGFVVVLGEVLMGDVFILMGFTISDLGQFLFLLVILLLELKKWRIGRTKAT